LHGIGGRLANNIQVFYGRREDLISSNIMVGGKREWEKDEREKWKRRWKHRVPPS